jgi:hypothetical protein
MGSWKRRGYRFVNTIIYKVLATKDPNLWFAITSDALWATTDAGNNWSKVFHTGGRELPRWLSSFHGDPKHLWMITNRQIYRIGGSPKLAPGPDRSGVGTRRLPHRVLDVPALHNFHVKVLKHGQVYFPQIQSYRDRGPWAAFLPSLTVGAHWAPYGDYMNIKDWMHAHWPYHYYNSSFDQGITWEVFARWDLGRLVFDRRKLPHWGRIDRNLAAVRQDVAERVQRLYQEYVRVAKTLVTRPPADPLVFEYHKIRLQEITAYFDAISGGYWSEKTGGIP